MVIIEIGIPTPSDLVLVIVSLAAIFSILGLSYLAKKRGSPSWLTRKIIHIGISSLIALTLHSYDNLTGPGLVLMLFLLIIFLGKLVFGDPVIALLRIASREGGSRTGTLFSGLGALLAYSLVFILLYSRPEIFTSAILAVSWGDGSGELVGRPFGKHQYSVWGKELSVEGSVSVLVFSFVGFIISYILFSTVFIITILLPLVLIALVVSVVEAVSVSWTDNFFIPLAVAFLMVVLIPA